MLNNEKLIHRLTLDQKIHLLISNKEYEREPIDDYEFPSLVLKENPLNDLRDRTGVYFPSLRNLARTFNDKLTENYYSSIANDNDRYSDNLFFKINTSFESSFIDDEFLYGKFISSQAKGILSTNSKVVLEKKSMSDNFELSMLSLDILLNNNNIEYIFVNDEKEIKYHKEINNYRGEFFAKTAIKENVVKLLSKGITMVFYLGNYEELKKYILNAINNYQIKLQQYNNREIDLAEFNSYVGEGIIISLESIDKACDHLIELFKKVNDFKDKEKLLQFNNENTYEKNKQISLDTAKQIAQESIVLLKNNKSVLPLKFNQKVAFIGEPFKEIDSFREEANVKLENFKSGTDIIKDYEEITYTGYAHGYSADADVDFDLENKAIKLANESDKIVLYLKAYGDESKLRENQLHLIDELSKTNKPIIVCLFANKYIELDFLDKIDALLYCGSLGQYTHESVLNIFAGFKDPCGRLTSEYPILVSDKIINENDIPSYCNKNPKLFPFGYGMSYGSFELKELVVQGYDVYFLIENTSDYKCTCVPQLFVSKTNTKSSLKNKLLKGYAKVEIEPHETVKVLIPLDELTFRSYDKDNNLYGCEGGKYNIYVGLSSEDLRLNATIELPQFINNTNDFKTKIVQEELNEKQMLEFIEQNVPSQSSKKSKYIINTLLLIYVTLSGILIMNSLPVTSTTLINIIIVVITVLIDAFLIYRYFKIHKIIEVKKEETNDVVLTKMLDEVRCYNPVATYHYNIEDGSVKFKEEPIIEEEPTSNEETKQVEENNELEEISDEEKEKLLEKVEVEQEEESQESIYDEDASLSVEEIEKYEEQEMKIIEEQENSKLNQFEEDSEEEINFDNESNVSQIIKNFMDFAQHKGLVLDLESVRKLFSAFASSKMIFLTTNMNDQLDLLLDIINQYFANKSRVVTANDNWVSLFSLSWLKDENNQYIKSYFIQDMYKFGLKKNNFNIEIIKNVNLNNFGLYFKKCINFANNPTRNYSLEISKQIKVFIPHNVHFIICPQNADYIKDIDSDVANASVFIEVLINRKVEETPIENEISYISDSYFKQLIHESLKTNYLSETNWKKIDELIEEVNKYESFELPNKCVLQIERYAAIYKDSGGDEIDLLDNVLANKIIPLIKCLEFSKTSEGYKNLKDSIERIFDVENVKHTLQVLAIKENA